MNKHKLLIFSIFFGIVILFSSCKGVKVRHGKDCGCGSFSQHQIQKEQPQ